MNGKLPGLNGLRAIAAILVLFIHTYEIAGLSGDSGAAEFYDRFKYIGQDMVNLFFVISGFIITYILYKERAVTGTVSLKMFYIKRFLRIWPLYFGLLILGYLLMIGTDVYAQFPVLNQRGILLLMTFLVTIAPLGPYTSFSVFPHYWSLSVEEQYYIVWPYIFKKLKGRAVLTSALVIILGMILLRNGFEYQRDRHPDPASVWAGLSSLFMRSKFGSIAIGVIGAYMLFHRSAYLKWIYSKSVQVVALLIFLAIIFFGYYIPYVHFEATAIVYLVLILNVTSNPAPLISFENKFLDHAGKISYGIYMFHWLIIPVVVYGVKKFNLWETFIAAEQLPLLGLGFLATYAMATLSFNTLERYFLKMKPAH